VLLNNEQLDLFTELINIGVGKAAKLLNELISSPIKLSIPKIIVERPIDLVKKLKPGKSTTYYAVKLQFEGSFNGITEIVFPSESGNNLVSILTGEEPYSDELDGLRAGTLNEVANILLNGVMGTISNIIKEDFNYSIPVYSEDIFENLFIDPTSEDKIVLFGETHFVVESADIEGDIIVLLELFYFESLKSELNRLLSE
jgi:chemotaxis protein CheC